jgi:hypothetical protein
MSEQSKDGGPAFPATRNEFVPCVGGYGETMSVEYAGMSLRDWFAGQALIGICQAEMGEREFVVEPSTLANAAYKMADAMLKQRAST